MTQQYTRTNDGRVELARSGDAQAIEELRAEYVARTRRLAWSFAQSSGLDVEDLVQDVEVRFFVKWHLIINAKNPLPYACKVARNHLINKYRKVARRRQIAPMMPLVEGWC